MSKAVKIGIISSGNTQVEPLLNALNDIPKKITWSHVKAIKLSPGSNEAVDFALLVLQHLDIQSINEATTQYQAIKGTKAGILLSRLEQQQDFKVACPHCNQKLWVRDNDVGKRGRCPSCKRAFVLPSQETALRSALPIGDHVLISKVNIENPEDIVTTIKTLFEQTNGDLPETLGPIDQQILNQTTQRVEIPDSELE